MLYRTFRYSAGWDWLPILQSPDVSVSELMQQLPACASWLEQTMERRSSHIAVTELPLGQSVLQGTLMFQVSEEQGDIQPLHFWITLNRIVTIHGDMRLSMRLQQPGWQAKIEQCRNAPEALFIMLNAMLDVLHNGIDDFKHSLRNLEEDMRHRNRTQLMDAIFDRRYELLYWSHLILPIAEIEGAAKEAFIDLMDGMDSYQRLQFKLERLNKQLEHYSHEIGTLIAMDDAISNFRGNEIMKTLTIFTVLFTPATVAGALWGMNFRQMPWLTSPWGFVVVCGIVSSLTLLIYLWLWHKGWTGDLLRLKNKQPLPHRHKRGSLTGSTNRRLAANTTRREPRAANHRRTAPGAEMYNEQAVSRDTSTDEQAGDAKPLRRSRKRR